MLRAQLHPGARPALDLDSKRYNCCHCRQIWPYMAPWMHHRVLRLIFAPCAHCLSEVDAANDRKALSQFDQAGPPLPVSVTPAALPEDDPAEVHEEVPTADDVPPAAVEVPEEPPLTPAQRAPPPAPAAPLTVGAPPAEAAAEDTDVGLSPPLAEKAAEDMNAAPPAEAAAEDTDVALPAEEAAEDTDIAPPAEKGAEDTNLAQPAEEAAAHSDVALPAEEVAEDLDVAQPAEETAEDTDVATASVGHVDGEEHQPAQPTAAQETEEEAAQAEDVKVVAEDKEVEEGHDEHNRVDRSGEAKPGEVAPSSAEDLASRRKREWEERRRQVLTCPGCAILEVTEMVRKARQKQDEDARLARKGEEQVLKETKSSANAHNIVAQQPAAAPADGECAEPSAPVAAAPAAGPTKAGGGKKKGKGKCGRSKQRAR